MGVNYRDVEGVNQAIANLGQSFVQNRQLDEQKQRDISRELLQQKMLEMEQRRTTAAEAGHITQPFEASGPDGTGTGVYTGTPDGWKQMVDAAEAKGRTLKPTTGAPKKAPYTFKTVLPTGELTLNFDKIEDADKAIQHFKAAGAKAPNHNISQAAPIAIDNRATELDDQASELDKQMAALQAEQSGGNIPGVEGQQLASSRTAAIKEQRDAIAKRSEHLRKSMIKVDPTAYETQTEVSEGGIGQPKVTTSRKVPVGQGAAKPGAGAGKKLDVNKAKEYLKAAGGDKDAARAAAKKDGYIF